VTIHYRIEVNRASVIDYLREHKYPIEWTEQMLGQTLMVRLFDDEGTVGYVWGVWIDEGVLAIHACVGRRYGVWLRSIARDLEKIAFWLGADDLVIGTEGVPHARLLARLAKQQGYEESELEGQQIFIKNLWSD